MRKRRRNKGRDSNMASDQSANLEEKQVNGDADGGIQPRNCDKAEEEEEDQRILFQSAVLAQQEQKASSSGPPGETKLEILLANSVPIVNPGEYVWLALSDNELEKIPRNATLFEFKEKLSARQNEEEGTTIVLKKERAEKHGFTKFDYVSAWISLEVQSSLEAVGLTAVFAKALADAGVSANVVAGYFHDHIFVDVKDREKAETALVALSAKYKEKLAGNKK